MSQSNSNILELNWQPLRRFEGPNDRYGVVLNESAVTYFVTTSDKLGANLQSACAVEENVWQQNGYNRFMAPKGQTTYQVALAKGKEYSITVLAQIELGEDKGTIIPYSQFSISLSGSGSGNVDGTI